MLETSDAPLSRFSAPVDRFADRIRRSAGWRRVGIAVTAGSVSVLSMAPFHLWPILTVTLPVLVWLIDGAVETHPDVASRGRVRRWLATPAGRASTAAWLFAFGYFLFGLFWIGEAFLVEAEKFAVLIPLAITLMPAGLALFWAGAAAIAATWGWRPGLARIITLALALSAAEWLRGHVFTGFPWNILGYALTYPLPLMQSSAVIGIYGLTLVVVISFAAPLVLIADAVRAGPASDLRRSFMLAVGFGLAPVLAMTLWGSLRLTMAEGPPTGVTVRVVQPSVPQREKWRPENQERIFLDHLQLSKQNAAGEIDNARGIQLIVWPEAAMPFLPLDTPVALQMIGDMLPAGTHLASGGLRLDPADAKLVGSRRRIYNSLIVFGAGGQPVATYDKIHLVPFGEYLPAQATLESIGLEQLSRLRGGFESGPMPRPLLAIAGLPPLLPLVCYEAIFPRAIVQGDQRPAALLNITNDGWFGNTTGPRQHLHQARVRAVEEGLPLIRAANNGISAIIDARGRVIGRLDLDVRASIDAMLPTALAPTFYARFGDGVFWIVWLGLLAILRIGMKSYSTK